LTGSAEEVRYDPGGFDYSLPETSDFSVQELYPDREHELLNYLFPKVAGGDEGFLARRARERKDREAEAEHREYLAKLREQAQFKLSSRNPRVASLSPDEGASLHELLVSEVQGGVEMEP
jgi:hypothetical protein